MILTELECSGRFRIVRRIRDETVASVYEAELLGAEGFSKRVALKVITPAFSADPEFLLAFLRETTLSANLMHGNIVQTYQLGEADGEYFVAMELIHGPSLRMIIDRHREKGRPLPPPLAAYIVSRVCRALDYAHMFVDPRGGRVNIIHSDISAANILSTWDGHIKLANFGVSRALSAAAVGSSHIAQMRERHYLSPEQRSGAPLDDRSDVYSLGLVLYELLALDHLHINERPATSDNGFNPQALPEFGQLLPSLDAMLEYILRRALEPEPARRPSAAMFGTDLDRWIAAQHTHGSPDRLQSHLAQLFPHDFSSAVWTENLATGVGFSALERAVRHNSNGRAGLLERWFGR
jgi:serine/threonine protein kinase